MVGLLVILRILGLKDNGLLAFNSTMGAYHRIFIRKHSPFEFYSGFILTKQQLKETDKVSDCESKSRDTRPN